MRLVGLLLMAIAFVATGCAATIGHPPTGDTSGDVDVSGKWVGTWRAYDAMGNARTEDATAELLQQGARGSGRLVLHTTGIAVSVPQALRDPGLSGTRVTFEVDGSEVDMRDARGARLFRADLKLEGDRMVGYVRGAKPNVRIVLTRAQPPSTQVAAAPPAPRSSPRVPAPVVPAPVAPAPAAPEPTKTPEPVAAAPAPAQTPAAAEAERPTPKEFTAMAEVKPIYFDFDKYDIRPDDGKILEADVDWLKTNAEALVLIEGHCDERGTPEYNLALGERRARAARDSMISSGIAAERISIVSLGAENPVCTEANEECWSKNRRANFLVRPR